MHVCVCRNLPEGGPRVPGGHGGRCAALHWLPQAREARRRGGGRAAAGTEVSLGAAVLGSHRHQRLCYVLILLAIFTLFSCTKYFLPTHSFLLHPLKILLPEIEQELLQSVQKQNLLTLGLLSVSVFSWHAVPCRFIYMYCEGSKTVDNGTYEFETKSWGPPDLSLQNIAYQLQQQVWKEGQRAATLLSAGHQECSKIIAGCACS